MADIALKLRDGLDPAPYAEIYAREGVVQVPDLLEPDAAAGFAMVLERGTSWRLAYADERRGVRMLEPGELSSMSPDARAELSRQIADQARRNIGFVYQLYPMIEAYTKGWDPGHPLHILTEFLNGPDFLEFGAAVIGCPGVNKADVQATHYGPGNFLTRHTDLGDERERRCALTLGLSRRWEPDWGGLLLFIDDERNISRGFTPKFNALTLFRQDRIHTVTQVANFAGQGRYSISGWLRDDPPARLNA